MDYRRSSPSVVDWCWCWCWCWWALTNVAFLVVVCWLTAGRDPWWMGPAMSAGYAMVWFAVAHVVVRSINKDRVETTPIKSTGRNTSPNPESKSCKNPKKVGLAVMICCSCGGVVTVCLTVLGWYLARVAIHCSSDDCSSYNRYSYEKGYYDPGYYGTPNSIPDPPWTTDLSRLPVSVQDWAASTLSKANNPMWAMVRHPDGGLVYLPGSRTTVFSEWDSDYSSTLASTVWSVSPTAPQPVALYKGRSAFDFVRVHDDQACFVTQRETDDESDESGYYTHSILGDLDTVACTDGTIVTMTAASATITTATEIPIWPFQHRTGPRNLHFDLATGLVWYPDYYFSSYGQMLSEPLIYSLDPTTMVETLYSQIRDGGDGDDSGAVVQAVTTEHLVASASSSSVSSDCFDHCKRHTRAFLPILLAVVITSLPVVVSSLYLWRQQQQQRPAAGSSSPPPPQHHLMVLVTLLAGMSALTLMLAYAWSPRNDPYGDKKAFLSWWTMCVGGAVALFCALMIDRSTNNDKTNNNKNNNKILRWGRNIGAWVYFRWGIAVILTTTWYGHLARDALLWIVFNAVVVAPLTVMGLVTESLFVLLVAAAGVLVDAYHLSFILTHRHSPRLFKTFIAVLVTGGTGVVVTAALAYWWMRHRHPDLLAVVVTHLEAYCAPWWHRRRGTTTATGTTATFTAIPIHDDNDNNNRNDDTFDYQQAPPTTSAAVAEETAAAASRGMETLADMLRRWADQLDRMRLAHQPESAVTA